jgi:hypothetical protein
LCAGAALLTLVRANGKENPSQRFEIARLAEGKRRSGGRFPVARAGIFGTKARALRTKPRFPDGLMLKGATPQGASKARSEKDHGRPLVATSETLFEAAWRRRTRSWNENEGATKLRKSAAKLLKLLMRVTWRAAAQNS